MMRTLKLLLLAIGVMFLGMMPAFAERPKLEDDKLLPITSTSKVGEKLQFNLRYTDKDGDKLKNLVLKDAVNNQSASFSDYKAEGQPDQGMSVTFTLSNGLPEGGHTIYFEGENEAGEKVRYPEEGKFIGLSVVDEVKKWILVGIVSLLAIVGLPYFVYLIARSINKQGNPSSAARMSLLVGILVALGVLIWQFLSSPLVIGVGVIVALMLLVLVLTRR
jgi:lipid-A-disaccharide synthase-like uncharacterized protein